MTATMYSESKKKAVVKCKDVLGNDSKITVTINMYPKIIFFRDTSENFPRISFNVEVEKG